ncbi:MAG: DNA mismatch repair protein MutS [Spirochaetales bacterium]|nr:DNA mismatch repair protein MutS [Spirochaetales bacterium]
MERNRDELTPMMRQYQEIKGEHPDKVLFFRLGDFYEMFDDDALEVSRLLNLTLTHRAGQPMCGIPFHAAKNYLKRLLDAGKKVAICEQLSLPEKSGELAKREVIQIYTPGTIIEDDFLDSSVSNHILAVNYLKGEYVAAWTDISTGEFFMTHLKKDSRISALSALIASLFIREIVVSDDLYFTDGNLRSVLDSTGFIITKLPVWYFSLKEARRQIAEQFGAFNPTSFGFEESDSALTAAGGLLKYALEMCRTPLKQIRNIRLVTEKGRLGLDEATEKNLELVRNLSEGKSAFTLYSAINRTCTSAGSRLLREVILNPLSDIGAIEERLSWCQYLFDDIDERRRVRSLLSSSADLIRLTSKFEMGRSVPRDLISVKETLLCFFSLAGENEKYLSLLDRALSRPDELLQLTERIGNELNPECTNLNHQGRILLDGFDEELDRLRSIENSSGSLLDEYLERIKSESGISILKLGNNKIIGTYLEVPKGQVNHVPDYFVRRQTLVNGERFTTPELIELESRIASAAGDAARREMELYQELVESTAALATELRSIGNLLSLLDLYQSFAEVSSQWNYTRPHMVERGRLKIEEGRHPVVEQHLPRGGFVSNSLDTEESGFFLITGPNMAGKSTFLRQTALIVLLSHIGCFVPAASAVIPITDRLFCRVGASDNLARGESTFLVEMQESAYILRNASEHSLVIMDEVGRGTSTQDGMSIAYAMMKYLLDVKCVTLFATHYHELTMLDTTGMQLLTLEVEENRNQINFIRKVIKGVAKSSYGLHVAKLGGVPQSVIRVAAAFQKQHFSDYRLEDETGQMDLFTDTGKSDEDFRSRAMDEILDLDITGMTPLDALMFLSSLQEKIRKELGGIDS